MNMKDTGKMVSASWYEYEKAIFMEMWERESNCSRVGTVGTESAVRKRGGSRNLPYLNAKPRQIPLLGTYAAGLTAEATATTLAHVCI